MSKGQVILTLFFTVFVCAFKAQAFEVGFCDRMFIAYQKVAPEHNGLTCKKRFVKSAKTGRLKEQAELNRYPDPQFNILVLSPKWSTAYDISTAEIARDFRNSGIKTNFTLFNYEGNEVEAEAMVEWAQLKQFDLIFSMGSKATDFVSRNYKDGAIPVVSACSKDPIAMGYVDPLLMKSQNNIAYTSLNISVDTQLAYIKSKFLSDLTDLAIIYDTNNTSSVVTQVKPFVELQAAYKVKITEIGVDLKDPNHNLEGKMNAFVELEKSNQAKAFLVTGSSELYENVDLINAYAQNVPVLSVTPSHVEGGERSVFMAIGVSFESNARLAANYAKRILLHDGKAGDLPVGLVKAPDIAINLMRKPAEITSLPINFLEDALHIFNSQGEPMKVGGLIVSPAKL